MALLSLFAPSPIRTIPSASESHRTLPCGSRAYQKVSPLLSFRAQPNHLAHRRSGIGPVRPSPCPEGWLFSCQAHYDRLSPHASSRGGPPVRAIASNWDKPTWGCMNRVGAPLVGARLRAKRLEKTIGRGTPCGCPSLGKTPRTVQIVVRYRKFHTSLATGGRFLGRKKKVGAPLVGALRRLFWRPN